MYINLIWARQFLFSNHWPLLIFFYLKSVTFFPAVFQGMSITTNITFAVIAFVLVLSFAWFDCIRSPNWKGRSVSKTPSNIYYGAFVENSWRFLACNYFLRKASSQMLHRFVSQNTNLNSKICKTFKIWQNNRQSFVFSRNIPVGIYLLKVNNNDTRTTPMASLWWRRSGIFIVNFEHIPHLVLVFLLLTLNM